MKKIIGVLGTAALALTMFMNTNSMSRVSTNLDLASLGALNIANAECPTGTKGICHLNTSGEEVCWANVFGNNCE